MKKEERLQTALKYHERFKRNFPKSAYLKETESLVQYLDKELTSLIALKTQTNGL
jgi:outer membrane protein assembly factor BamD